MGTQARMLLKKIVAEALGTALLLATVVGSGIMGEQLARPERGDRAARQHVATGAALVALILTFGPISGAHFNPAVTLADASQGGLPWREVPAYSARRCWAPLPASPSPTSCSSSRRSSSPPSTAATGSRSWSASSWRRSGCSRSSGARRGAGPGWCRFAVGAYITAAYWFTASTSFANPAVTLARAASDTFAGIRPADAPGFIVAQLAGGRGGHGALPLAGPCPSQVADRVVDRFPPDEELS